MGKDAGLVPITREYFRQLYSDVEIPPFSAQYEEALGNVEGRLKELREGSFKFVEDEKLEVPLKMEETMYCLRHLLEASAELFSPSENSPHPPAVQGWAALREFGGETLLSDVREPAANGKTNATEALRIIEDYQEKNAERVKGIVRGFLPKDFRAQLFLNHQEKSDRKKKKALETLMAKGGTLADKYDKLWGDQLERRKKLAQIGGATGVFAALVKLLAGIPQVLLDFVKQINDKEGPMEEIRAKFGPSLYKQLEGANSLIVLLSTVLHPSNSERLLSEGRLGSDLTIASTFVGLLKGEIEVYLDFCAGTIGKAPFFVKAEELASEGKGGNGTSAETLQVDARAKSDLDYEVMEGDAIEYELTVEAKDIGFYVVLDGPSGEVPLLPNKKYDSGQGTVKGSISAPSDGILRFVFDNTYSVLTSKKVKFVAKNAAELERKESSKE